MYILGIAGWTDRGHDASAALLDSGKLIATAEEERFIRRKHSYDILPHNAIRFCLDEAKICIEDLDYVALYWDWPYHYKLRGIVKNLDKEKLIKELFPQNLFKYEKAPELKFINHHRSHAASVFRSSGFDESAILIVDGAGEDVSTSLWYGVGNEIMLLKKIDVPGSIGYFYEGVTHYVGLESNEPGKTMGLAPYGKASISTEELFELTKDGYRAKIPEGRIVLGLGGLSDEEEQLQKYWNNIFVKRLGSKNERVYRYNRLLGRYASEAVMNQHCMDAAASAQKILEDLMLHLTKVIMEETSSRNLSIAGGVGLNCIANGKILQSGLVDDIFIQPAANDAGCSLGAALELYAELGYPSKFKMEHTYLGPKFSKEDIESELNRLKLEFEYHNDIESVTSELLNKNKIIGWFQGRMELGPRALGNRSILADPRDSQMKDKINKYVKFREWFRPFAPSILEEYSEDYLVGAYPSPFMLLAFDVPEDKRKEIPAVVHVDGTTRPQTVAENVNLRYWKLIDKFRECTGVPVVLNTSFNVKGEPIICTPYDAVRTFYTTGIDYLVLDNFLIKK